MSSITIFCKPLTYRPTLTVELYVFVRFTTTDNTLCLHTICVPYKYYSTLAAKEYPANGGGGGGVNQ